ncbi:MAG: hypothetical protein ACYDBJ_21535, partial [Aggregatilineales bacterium]
MGQFLEAQNMCAGANQLKLYLEARDGLACESILWQMTTDENCPLWLAARGGQVPGACARETLC